MTDHKTLQMHHEERRITDRGIIKGIIERGSVATVCLPDEPYPYCVPMNYGFEWNDDLYFYFHMAITGHKLDLLRKKPVVTMNIFEFLDRNGYRPYKKENHDYRSVTVFGHAEIITPDLEEEFVRGLSLLQINNNRPAVKKMTSVMREQLFCLKVTADIITAKAQYELDGPAEGEMPPLENVKRE